MGKKWGQLPISQTKPDVFYISFILMSKIYDTRHARVVRETEGQMVAGAGHKSEAPAPIKNASSKTGTHRIHRLGHCFWPALWVALQRPDLWAALRRLANDISVDWCGNIFGSAPDKRVFQVLLGKPIPIYILRLLFYR